MKIVTNDYGCGTSSSILDYAIEDAIVVSEDNWKFLLDVNDDLFFVGHDFLMYLWDTPEKVQLWKNFSHNKLVWAFEPIDAIIKQWRMKSHYSMSHIVQFADEIYACHEDDCKKYGYKFFPQWASCKFYEKRNNPVSNEKILFSGQAGIPEYAVRNQLLQNLMMDKETKDRFLITNIKRSLTWEQYVDNLLKHDLILNPYGILRAFNTRAYEVLYAGRFLLQHCFREEYSLHQELIKDVPNAITFFNKIDLMEKLENIDVSITRDPTDFYQKNNLYARFKAIGVELK